ncbi:MAG: hypothetical protein FWF94_02870 [Oscillospiraceae bacterium]|nr:hypothetical protein [Oscillospiraceae bacterium]
MNTKRRCLHRITLNTLNFDFQQRVLAHSPNGVSVICVETAETRLI